MAHLNIKSDESIFEDSDSNQLRGHPLTILECGGGRGVNEIRNLVIEGHQIKFGQLEGKKTPQKFIHHTKKL